MMTDNNDPVVLHKNRCRTNLRNAELSKRTFRIFLEKQILSHVETEIQKNTQDPQTPLTSNFNFNESDLASSEIRLTLSSFQTVPEEKSSIKNNLTLPNLDTKIYSSNNALKITDALVSHDTDSEINIYENPIQDKSKPYIAPGFNQNTSTPKMSTTVNKQSNYGSIYATSPEWFQDNETVSVHGSLLSETMSDISAYNSDLKSTNRKPYRWRRLLFCCCVN
ncbi:hypothetical protein PUN28_012104 [Cardiocondyla obscurior]|uniref:Uncharacterized protein n=1 Tax=Cardiocondyla obscurior TaxID=286306 RepID=A0AAW2FCB5_9HYME